MAEEIQILAHVCQHMLEEAHHAPEVECCGLLAGRDGIITAILPARNTSADASGAYEIAPAELFRMFRQMRAEGLQHLGIYHSHPRGPNLPSPADVERAFYPDAAYVILSPLPGVSEPVRAFQIRNGQFAELRIHVL